MFLESKDRQQREWDKHRFCPLCEKRIPLAIGRLSKSQPDLQNLPIKHSPEGQSIDAKFTATVEKKKLATELLIDFSKLEFKIVALSSCWGCGLDWATSSNFKRWGVTGLSQTPLAKMKESSRFKGGYLCPDCYEEVGMPENDLAV